MYIQDNTGDGSSSHTLNNNCALTIGGSSSGNTNNFATPAYSIQTFGYGHGRFYTAALTAAQVAQNWTSERTVYNV